MGDRNMIEANKKIFTSLDDFCARRSEPIKNSGTARWITTDKTIDRSILKSAQISTYLSFASRIKIARFNFGNSALFCTVGFDLPDQINDLTEVEVGGGILTMVLAELSPAPTESTLSIKNVVEALDRDSDSSYVGHDPNLIWGLYPPIRCFSTDDLSNDETERVFFKICLADLSRAQLWMDEPLKDTLQLITVLSPTAIPYRTLSRSIFDTDPSALFMALYRCIEALYAYSHASKLVNKLNIKASWTEVASTLEDTLGWRPREAESLASLLEIGIKEDLQTVMNALNEKQPEGETNLVTWSSKRIYKLRNSLVHYRPLHQDFELDSVNWNRACEGIALLVLHISEYIRGQRLSANDSMMVDRVKA